MSLRGACDAAIHLFEDDGLLRCARNDCHVELLYTVCMKKIILALAGLLFCAAGFADDVRILGFSVQGKSGVFKLDPVKDGLLSGAGVALSGSDLVFDEGLKLNRADYDPLEIYNNDNINSFDRFFMNSYDSKLDDMADIGCAVAMLAPAVLMLEDKDEWITIGVMYAETLLIANGVKEWTKNLVNRARPYIYYDDEKPEDALKDGDWAKSFFSGHTTMAFAGASFASYTFCKYNPDSPWRYAVIGGSYALAGGTAALRIKSGNHFMSDVLTGACVGTVIGIWVPWLHTFNEENQLNVAIVPNGVYFKVTL